MVQPWLSLRGSTGGCAMQGHNGHCVWWPLTLIIIIIILVLCVFWIANFCNWFLLDFALITLEGFQSTSETRTGNIKFVVSSSQCLWPDYQTRGCILCSKPPRQQVAVPVSMTKTETPTELAQSREKEALLLNLAPLRQAIHPRWRPEGIFSETSPTIFL